MAFLDVHLNAFVRQRRPGIDLPAFFYHPFLEFDSIVLDSSHSLISYAADTPLKRLIAAFKANGFIFLYTNDLIDFVPSSRFTDFLPDKDTKLFAADTNGDGRSELVTWKPSLGAWQIASVELPEPPLRRGAAFRAHGALWEWAIGEDWVPLVGDFDGDGKDDIVAWLPLTGEWQVALSDGEILIPQGLWLNDWAFGAGWFPFVGDFNGDGKDDLLVWHQATGSWQVALSDGGAFVPTDRALRPWAAGSSMEPIVGVFTSGRCASLAARQAHLRGGCLDFAVSVMSKQTGAVT